MASSSFQVDMNDGRLVNISSDLDGRLKCMACPGANWCQHTQFAITNGLDAYQLWSRVTIEKQAATLIPLMPRQDVWVKVLFEQVNDEVIRLDYWDKAPISRDGWSEFIGFLNKGESRMHVRQMVLDWFMQYRNISLYTCVGARHNWQRDLQMTEQCRRSEIDHFLQCWSLKFTGFCKACMTDPGGFDPDLIPRA